MTKQMFTVLILKEYISEKGERYLEESGFLVKLDKDFFNSHTPKEILSYFQNCVSDMEILTEEGEPVTQKVVRVLDAYPVKDPVEAEDFTEVWSLPIRVDSESQLAQFLTKYYKGKYPVE